MTSPIDNMLPFGLTLLLRVSTDILDTFIVYNERRRVTSSAKKKRKPSDTSLHQVVFQIFFFCTLVLYRMKLFQILNCLSGENWFYMQTPDGSLLDILRNAYDLLSQCDIDLPEVFPIRTINIFQNQALTTNILFGFIELIMFFHIT